MRRDLFFDVFTSTLYLCNSVTPQSLSGSHSCRPVSPTKVRQPNMAILLRRRHWRPATTGTVGGGSSLLKTLSLPHKCRVGHHKVYCDFYGTDIVLQHAYGPLSVDAGEARHCRWRNKLLKNLMSNNCSLR